jgi:hypothetical protein
VERRNLPEAKLVGSKIEQPAPCGEHAIYFPAMLVQRAMQGTYSVFVTACACGTTYMVSTETTRTHFRMHGGGVPDFYEELPWLETEYEDSEGTFFFKTAPSLEELQRTLGDPPEGQPN